jgi:signal transduction histidine kinase/CheY-like chemotaxis protein
MNAPPTAGLVLDGAAAPAAHDEDTPLLAERVRMLAELSGGAVVSTLVGALLIGLVLAVDVGPLRVSAWIAAYIAVALWRMRFSAAIVAGRRAADARALRGYMGFALFNGLWTGALPIVFFSALGVETRVALTVVTLLALTAGAVTFASYRGSYLMVLALALPPLVYEWAVLGSERAWLVVTTLVVFGLLMVRTSKHLADVFVHSVRIRFEREAVVRQLEHEKRLTEIERQKAEEANRAKSRFLANASHDLRQPAHALGLFTGVLEDTAQTQQHRDLARHIASASRVLGALLDNLLDISRLDAGIVAVAPRPLALKALLERLRADTQRIAGLRPIAVTADSDDTVALLDPVLVERALRNLLDNALKFTTTGQIALSAHARGDWVELQVRDTGCGIAPDQHRLVFEEFYQIGNAERDHRKGLGLGLSIVARLVELMQGSVSVESVPGGGATFTLRLPLRNADAGEAPAPPPQRLTLAGQRVLVIDDEAMVRTGMRELLSSWGAEVDEADGLAAALSLLDGRASGWHVCLCDLRLRDGENGIRTAAALRERQPGLPVILISGDTAPHRIEEAMRSGLRLLHKPVAPAQLATALTDVLRPAAP